MTLVTLAAPSAWAKKKAKPVATKASAKAVPGKEVSTALNSYRAAGSIKAKVKKTVVQEALGTETKSEGNFYFSKGKLRMEILEPEHSLLVFDGKVVWFETPIDETRVHVTKMRANELKKADSLLTALFDRKDILKTFKLKGDKAQEAGGRAYTFEPKDKKKSEVKMLEIAIKDKDIQRITYLDQVDNRVTLEFTDMTKGSVPADKFIYKVPKKADLVEM